MRQVVVRLHKGCDHESAVDLIADAIFTMRECGIVRAPVPRSPSRMLLTWSNASASWSCRPIFLGVSDFPVDANQLLVGAQNQRIVASILGQLPALPLYEQSTERLA